MKYNRLLALLTLIMPLIASAQPQTWPHRGTHVDKWTNPDKSPYFWSIKQLRDVTNLTETATSFDSLGLTQRVTVGKYSTTGGPRFLLTGGSTRTEYDSGWPLSTNYYPPNPTVEWTFFDESFAQGIATRDYSDGSSWFRVRTSDALIRWHAYDTQYCSSPASITATVVSLWRVPEQRNEPWLTLTKSTIHPGEDVLVPLPRRLGGFLFCMDFDHCITCGESCNLWPPLATVPPPAASPSMIGSPAGIAMGSKGPTITILGITGDVYWIDKSATLSGPWSHVGELTIGEEATGTWEDLEPMRGSTFYQMGKRQ